MGEIQLLLEFDDDVDATAAAAHLRESLATLDSVEDVEVEADRRTVERVDVVGTVNSVTAVVTALGGGAAATALLLNRLTEVVNAVGGLRQALVRRADGSTVPLSEISADEVGADRDR
jgi:hypothetical protein